MQYLDIPSPVGILRVTSDGEALTRLDWVPAAKASQSDDPILNSAREQLREYFEGVRKVFTLPLRPDGTKFSQSVWSTLVHIPFGETRSYGQLADTLRTAPRAFASGCGRNPIPIIIPCHRVVGANGNLGGYSGDGGIVTKQKLLRLEHEAA